VQLLYGSFLRPIDVSIDIFDESNGIVNISTNEDSFALVEHANKAVLAMFGYSASAVIGQNVNKLIAEPIASHHDAYIRNYLGQRQGSMVVDKTRMVLCRHANGHLLPLALYVRWSDESLGKMIAVMKVLASPQEICIIVDPETDRITAATANLHTICGLSRRDIAANRLSLAHVLPPLRDDDHDASDAALAQAKGVQGLHCDSEHAVTRQRFYLQAFVSDMPVLGGKSFRYVRLVVTHTHEAADELYSEVELMSDLEDVTDAASVAPTAAEASGSRRGVSRRSVMDSLDSAEALAKQQRKEAKAKAKAASARDSASITADSPESAADSLRSLKSAPSPRQHPPRSQLLRQPASARSPRSSMTQHQLLSPASDTTDSPRASAPSGRTPREERQKRVHFIVHYSSQELAKTRISGKSHVPDAREHEFYVRRRQYNGR
jgi:PAS domain S-box-containing protein